MTDTNKQSESIYLIHGIFLEENNNEKNKKIPDFSSMNLAFYKDEEKAKESIEKNEINVYERHESDFKYLVIAEKKLEEMYPYSQREIWYKYDREEDNYEICEEKPDKFKNIVM